MSEPTTAQVPWRAIILSAYLPTLLASLGFGAVVPLIALRATSLGASVPTAALITSLLGIGQLVGDLPAGWIASRLGDKRAMVLACVVDAAAMAWVFYSRTLPVLGAAVFVDGLSGAVFGLARQTYLTDVIPARVRARALSTLGGIFRVGWFIGPLFGAPIIKHYGLASAFIFAASLSSVAAIVTAVLPDAPPLPPAPGTTVVVGARHARTWDVVRDHRFVLMTQGTGVLMLMLVRYARQSVVPLWCEHIGLSPVATSLVFSVSMGFDVLLFFPGGAIMDRFGRWFVVVPSLLVMGIGLALLPLTHSILTVMLVAAVLGVGNGTSSGIVMTLGSDASPAVGRPQFLAGWRVLADTGNAGGPLVISWVSGFAGLAASSITVGVIAWVGAAWLGHWIGRRKVVPRKGN